MCELRHNASGNPLFSLKTEVAMWHTHQYAVAHSVYKHRKRWYTHAVTCFTTKTLISITNTMYLRSSINHIWMNVTKANLQMSTHVLLRETFCAYLYKSKTKKKFDGAGSSTVQKWLKRHSLNLAVNTIKSLLKLWSQMEHYRIISRSYRTFLFYIQRGCSMEYVLNKRVHQ
jgi:hypothetical protein